MQDQYVIMTRGFKNVVDSGAIGGYQINIRIPYYRGIMLSLVHYLELMVDGQEVPHLQMHIIVSGRKLTIAQMWEADDVHWDYGTPATLVVTQPGGLQPGMHTVQVGIVIRKSYLPPEDPEHLYDFFDLWKDGKYQTYIEGPTVVTKKMTLVQ